MNSIYCIGRNYVKHAQELGNEVPQSPVVFLKAWSSLRGLNENLLAFSTETFHHEIELVLKMKRDLDLGAVVTATDIEGIALGLDLTRRDVQTELKSKGLPWTLAKSFAGSAVLGHLRPFEERTYHFSLKVNGDLRQSGDSSLMLFPLLTLATYLNSFSPLKKGDLIFTGTPEGVGPLRKGDRFELCWDDRTESGTL